MKLYKSGLALKREGTDETVAAFVSADDLDYVHNELTANQDLHEHFCDLSSERDEMIEVLRKIYFGVGNSKQIAHNELERIGAIV